MSVEATTKKVLMSLTSVEFEVFGKVQGVFFRKGTQKICVQNDVVGWVKNTPRGTVVGVAQGEKGGVDAVKYWLSKVGTRRSEIDHCKFKNEKDIAKKEFTEFSIIR